MIGITVLEKSTKMLGISQKTTNIDVLSDFDTTFDIKAFIEYTRKFKNRKIEYLND